MINRKMNEITTKVTAGFLMIGLIAVSLPAFADEIRIVNKTPASGEPLQRSTGTIEDLEGIEVTSEWTWESEGKSEIVVDDSEENSVSNQLFTPLSIQEQNEKWQKTNQGDDRPFSAGISITDF